MSEGGGRLMTDEEINMQQLAELLDTALSSKDPIVMDQLQKLLMVAALTKSVDPLGKAIRGPIAQMAEEIKQLKSQMTRVNDKLFGDDTLAKMTRGKAGVAAPSTSDWHKMIQEKMKEVYSHKKLK